MEYDVFLLSHEKMQFRRHIRGGCRGVPLFPTVSSWGRRVICVSFFVKLSCVDDTDQPLLVYARNKQRDCEWMAQRCGTHVDKYSCPLLSNTNTPTTVSYCTLSPQDIGAITFPCETSEVKLQASTHMKCIRIYSGGGKGVQRVFAVAVFSPSISGRWGCSLCQVGKGHKGGSLQNHRVLHFLSNMLPFIHQPAKKGAKGKGRSGDMGGGSRERVCWSQIKLMEQLWIWLMKKTEIRHIGQNQPFKEL